MARPVGGVQRIRMSTPDARDYGRVHFGRLVLTVLRRLPEIVVEDAKVKDLGDEPFLRRVGARNLAPGLRVERPALAVPHQPPNIELVVEQPRALLRVAAQCVVGPPVAPRTGNAVVV
ncbi:MAG: hypothetical protein OXI81_15120 [Paracoccaceae bacterium]|nr:hypothetical protein [Paracoccaceae bacterium]